MSVPLELSDDEILRTLETSITTCLDSADKVFSELCKDDDADVNQIEEHAQIFLKTLDDIEKLVDQTDYWTRCFTPQPPKGTKEELTWRRIKHSTARIEELCLVKARHFRGNKAPKTISEQVAEADAAESNIPPNSST